MVLSHLNTHAHTGTRPEKIRIQKWYTVYKDHITLSDYEISEVKGLDVCCMSWGFGRRSHIHTYADVMKPSRTARTKQQQGMSLELYYS